MSNNFWIKLHHEILDDPKMGLMPDHLWRRTVEIFLLAGREGVDGRLPDVRAMSWALHVPIEQLEAEIAELEALGIVSRVDSGLIVTNFVKRQAKVDTKERMKAYRGRQRKAAIDAGPSVTDDSENGYANVTGRNTELDIELDIESNNKNKGAADENFFSLYETSFGTFSSVQVEELHEYADRLKAGWFEEAIKRTFENCRRPTWKYCKVICDDFIAHGRITGGKKGKRTNGHAQQRSDNNSKFRTHGFNPYTGKTERIPLS